MTGTVFYNSNRPERAVRPLSLRLCNSFITDRPSNGTIYLNQRSIEVNHIERPYDIFCSLFVSVIGAEMTEAILMQ